MIGNPINHLKVRFSSLLFGCLKTWGVGEQRAGEAFLLQFHLHLGCSGNPAPTWNGLRGGLGGTSPPLVPQPSSRRRIRVDRARAADGTGRLDEPGGGRSSGGGPAFLALFVLGARAPR